MKSYKEFLNETNGVKNIPNITDEMIKSLPINFKFIIDVTNFTDEEINKVFDEFEKYFIIDNHIKKYLVTKDAQAKPWAWRVEVKAGNFLSYDTTTINRFKRVPEYWVNFGIITSRGWGIGDGGVVDNRVTINEFLKVGLEGVKELIERKANINKYNL